MTDERFVRIERLVGAERFARLQRSFVVVAGLGAVGSYAVEALARAGVGRLRLVDFDILRPSNVNRQLLALEPNLGRLKVEVAGERVRQINPRCEVEALALFVHRETLDRVLEGAPDAVVDAIDAVTPKTELLAAARTRNLRIVSSMGAALRQDASALRVGTLGESTHCPLARQIRKRLRARRVPCDFPCVFSVEPVQAIPREAVDRAGAERDDALQRGRPRRVLGSLPTITGLFGLTAAHEVLRGLMETDGSKPVSQA